jgi:hypothetical protein
MYIYIKHLRSPQEGAHDKVCVINDEPTFIIYNEGYSSNSEEPLGHHHVYKINLVLACVCKVNLINSKNIFLFEDASIQIR